MPKLQILENCEVRLDSGLSKITFYAGTEVNVGDRIADDLIKKGHAKLVEIKPQPNGVSVLKEKRNKYKKSEEDKS